jgi:hypothetical protein
MKNQLFAQARIATEAVHCATTEPSSRVRLLEQREEIDVSLVYETSKIAIGC